MAIDKSLQTGSTSMLILKLIENVDMYGYQMIETLAERSNNVFALKAGTLYPLLRNMEEKGLVSSYEKTVDTARVRKYYSITTRGKKTLNAKQQEWTDFVSAVNCILKGGTNVATVC